MVSEVIKSSVLNLGFKEENISIDLLVDEDKDNIPNPRNIWNALRYHLNRTQKDRNDIFIFYFTGHGSRVKNTLILETSGSDHTKNPGYLLEFQEIANDIDNKSEAALNIIFLDACQTRDGALGNNNSAITQRDIDLLEGKKIVTFFSSMPGKKSYINKKTGYGYFTESLLKGFQLADKEIIEDKKVTKEELYKYVSRDVYRITREANIFPPQRPKLVSTGGDFNINMITSDTSLQIRESENLLNKRLNRSQVYKNQASFTEPPQPIKINYVDEIKIIKNAIASFSISPWDVGVSGGLAISSSFFSSILGKDHFFVNLYSKNKAGKWKSTIELPSNLTTDGEFGRSIDISEHTVIVGSPGRSKEDTAGEVSIMKISTDGTRIENIVRLSPQGRHFGWSVAIDNDWAAVSSPSISPNSIKVGTVFMYQRHGNSWDLEYEISPSTNVYDQFGYKIHLANDLLVISRPAASGPHKQINMGDGMIFERAGKSWLMDLLVQ